MTFARRILLFLAVNCLVLIMLSLVLSLFNIRPYITHYGIEYRSLMIFCLVWGMGGALISLALSKTIAKWAMRVEIVDPESARPDLKQLLGTVEALARAAQLKGVPEVGIFPSKEVNAFATGPSQRRSLVAVSTGLLERLSQREIEAVLAHEITHIANGDMVTMTLLQGVINAFVMFLARILASLLSGVGRGRNSSSGGSYGSYMLFVLLFEGVFMVLGSLVVAWFSRRREFRADRGGAGLTSREQMMAALKSLQKTRQIADPRVDTPAFQALKISTKSKGGFLRFFATHPPLEERIARLSD